MKFNTALNNFSAGEWSPKMLGRTDVQQYKNACATLENFIPAAQGGIFKRPGTERITVSGTHLWYGSNPAFSTMLNNFDEASNVPVLIPLKLSDGTKRVLFISKDLPSANWFAAETTGTCHDIYASNGSGADIEDFTVSKTPQWTQIGDICIITDISGLKTPRVWAPTAYIGGELRAHIDYAGYSATILGISLRTFHSVPYLPINALGNNVTLTASAATGTITVTASAAYFTGTTAQWSGTYIKLSAAGSTGVVRITSRVSDTVVNAAVQTGTSVPTVACGATAGTSWEESAWSNKRYWPKFCVAHEGRLIFGGHPNYPNTIWCSRIGSYFDFMERPFEQDTAFTGYVDDNSRPFTVTPSTQDVAAINGLSSGKTLVLHTENNEIVVSGKSGAFGPLDISMESSSSYGKDLPQAVRVDNYLTFVEAKSYGRNIRDFNFDFSQEQYKGLNLSLAADHLTILPDLVRAASQGHPYDGIKRLVPGRIHGASGILCITTFGRGLWLSLDREYNINAWSRITLGGAHGSSSQYQPYILDGCNLDGTIYLVVQRRINGSAVNFLEKISLGADVSYTNDLSVYGVYVDAYTTFTSGSPTTSVTGASHLEGQTVQVIADGIYVGTKVVSSGGFTLSSAASNVKYGLAYTATLKTMPFELGQQIPDSPQGLTKRIDELTVRFFNTYGAKYGVTASDLMPFNFFDPEAVLGDPPVMFSGIKTVKVPQKYSREPQLIIQQENPWPCNIISVIAKGVTYD